MHQVLLRKLPRWYRLVLPGEVVPAETVIVLPTLVELPAPVNPPIVEEENIEPQAPGTPPAAESPSEPPKPSSMQLATAFRQAQEDKLQLQEQGIYKLGVGPTLKRYPIGRGAIPRARGSGGHHRQEGGPQPIYLPELCLVHG